MQINASPMKSVSTPTIQKRKKSVWRRMVQYKSLYLFLLPAVVYLAIFHYGPMYGVLIAFQNFNGAKGIWGSDWVGLRHFEEFITGQNFWPIMSNTLSISLYTLIACFPFPIIVALCINELKSKRYAKHQRTEQHLRIDSHIDSVGYDCRIFVKQTKHPIAPQHKQSPRNNKSHQSTDTGKKQILP